MEGTSAWRDKLNSQHGPLQQSAVWAYVTQMPPQSEKGTDKGAQEAWKAYRAHALQHPAPAVVDAALFGLLWLVDAQRLPVAMAWRCVSQEWPHLPPAVWGTALELFHQLAARAGPHPPLPESELWISLARARPESVSALLARWESLDPHDLFSLTSSSSSPDNVVDGDNVDDGDVAAASTSHGSRPSQDMWSRRWAPFFGCVLEQPHDGPLAAWRPLVWAALRRLLDELTFLPSWGCSEDEGDEEVQQEQEEKEKPQHAQHAAGRLFHFLCGRVPAGAGWGQGVDQAYQIECVLSLGAYSQHAWQGALLSSPQAWDSLHALWARLLAWWADLVDRPAASPGADAGALLHAAGRLLRVWQRVEGWEERARTEGACYRHVLLVAFLLLRSHEGHQLGALRLLDAWLVPALTSHVYARLLVVPRLVYPLLHVMASATGRTKSLASQLLLRVERIHKSPVESPSSSSSSFSSSSSSCSSSSISSPSSSSPSSLFSSPSSGTEDKGESGWGQQMAKVMEAWVGLYAQAGREGRSVESVIEAHLGQLRAQWEEGPGQGEAMLRSEFFFFWHAPWVGHGSARVRQAACQCLQQAVRCAPDKCAGLLSLVLYQSERERDGPLQWAWLQLLAQLGGYLPLLPTVYRTFHAFLALPSMQAPGLRLLCRTWQGQDRAFRKFQSALLSIYESASSSSCSSSIGSSSSTVGSSSSSGSSPLGSVGSASQLIAVAASVRDVCKSRPSRGLELIALLSQLIQLRDQPHAKSLALQGLLHLGRADCVEFATAWAIIEKDVLPDPHPLVVEQRMNLLEGGLEGGVDLESPTTRQHLLWLWEGSQHAAPAVRAAAYRVLRAYIQQESGCVGLLHPQEGGAAFLPCLWEPSPLAAPAACRLVEAVLSEQVGQSRRAMQVAAAASSTAQHPLYAQCARQAERMEEAYVEGQRPPLTAGLAGAQLWSYEPALKKQASSTRGEALLLARAFHGRALDLLHDVFLSTWMTRVMGLSAWLRFGSRFLTLRVQADKAKREQEKEEKERKEEREKGAEEQEAPEGERSSSLPPHEQREKASRESALYGEAMSKIRALLGEKRTLSPATAENCVFMLVGCTLALPPAKHDLIEGSVDALLLLLADPDKSSNEREHVACLLGLACLTHALPLSDLPRVQAIAQVLLDALASPASESSEWAPFAGAFGAGLVARALLQKSKGLSPSHAQPALLLVHSIRLHLEQVLRQVTLSETSTSHTTSDSHSASTSHTASTSTNKSMTPLGASLGLAHLASALSEAQELQELWAFSSSCLETLQQAPRSIGMSGACLVHGALALRMYRLNLMTPATMEEILHRMKAWAFPLASAQGNLGACIALGSLLQGALLYGLVLPTRERDAIMAAYVGVLGAPQLSDSVREASLVGVANALGAGLILPLDGTQSLLEASASLHGALSHSTREAPWVDPLGQLLQAILLQPTHSTRLASSCAWVLGSLARPLPAHHTTGSSTHTLLQQLPEDSLLKALLHALTEGESQRESQRGGQREGSTHPHPHPHPQPRSKEEERASGISGESSQKKERILTTLMQVGAAKLPAWEWGEWVQPLLKGGEALSLRVAALRFLLHHAANASVSHLLSCVMEMADYQQLPPALQCVLLAHVPRLLATLPTPRALRLLHEHALLRQRAWRDEWAQPLPNPQSVWWPMLTALLGDPQLSSPVRQAALDELEAFLALLPLPLPFSSSSFPSSSSSSSSSSTDREWGQTGHGDWERALPALYYQVGQCVASLGDKLREQCLQRVGEGEGEDGPLKQAILVSVLVQQQCLPPARLVAQRSVCWTCPQESKAALVSGWMGEALRGVQDPATRQRWYQDSVDCALVMPHPQVVWRFLASLALAWVAPEVESVLGVRAMDWEESEGIREGGARNRVVSPCLGAPEGLEDWLPILLPRLVVHLAHGVHAPPLSPDTYVAQQRAWWSQQVEAHSPSPSAPGPPSALSSMLSRCCAHLHRALPAGVSIEEGSSRPLGGLS